MPASTARPGAAAGPSSRRGTGRSAEDCEESDCGGPSSKGFLGVRPPKGSGRPRRERSWEEAIIKQAGSGAPGPAGAALSVLVLVALAAGAGEQAPPTQSPQTSGETAGSEGAPRRRAYTNPPDAKAGTLPPGIGIPVGEQAPDAALRDSDGHAVRLSEVRKSGPVLLVFYRGGWCPYCNSQVHDLTTAYPEYKKRGVTPVAVSVDGGDPDVTGWPLGPSDCRSRRRPRQTRDITLPMGTRSRWAISA